MSFSGTALKDIHTKVSALYDNVDIAYALFFRDEDAALHMQWQNTAAANLIDEGDFSQPLFKLELMDCLSKQQPHTFDYAFSPSLTKMQFIATPFDDSSVLVQFYATPVAESFVPDDATKVDDNGVYQTLVESAKLGVVQWDILSDEVCYDERALQVFGMHKNKLGTSFQAFLAAIYQEDRTKVSDAIEEHLSADWPLNIEFRMVGENGTHNWVQFRGQALWAEDNTPIRLLASVEDISQRKYTEFELKQRESLIEQMIDALPLSIDLKDAQGCYRFFNREAERSKGMKRQELIGRTDFEVYSKEEAQHTALEESRVYESGRLTITEQEHEDGHGWILLGKIPITMLLPNNLTQIWILSFSLDITERKQMEDALKKANKIAEEAAQSKATFLSVMSHEIRTPLNSVIGNAGFLLNENLDDGMAEHVEMIKHSGEHLLHLINDILDFNKLEAGKVELIEEPFNLIQQVQNVLKMSATNAKQKQIEFKTDIADDIQDIYFGDEGRIRQILLNLIGNAVKFTRDGSITVRLFLKQDSNKLRFEIIDTGIGVSAENIPKLFSEFSQAEASTANNYGGSGLGLAICKKLVEAMDGEIGINSKVGVGSTFWFEIPSKPSNQTTTSKTYEKPSLDVENLTILVAEDNLPNQFLIKTVLSKLGHQVVIANNGKEALEALHSEKVNFDLVLMDMQMPEMDGLQATREIRLSEVQKINQIPIIALTANAYTEAYDAVMSSGMNACLTKPLVIDDLKAALNQWGGNK